MIKKEEYIEKAKERINKLDVLKNNIKQELPEEIAIDISGSNDINLKNAVKEIFGSDMDDKITLEMYLQCMKIVRMAGQASSRDLINSRR